MLALQRQQQIYELIQKKKSVTVSQLCSQFFISPATARRDLDVLEKNGQIRRNHGGAVIAEGGNKEISVFSRQSEHRKEKALIARLASLFLQNDQTLFLDPSSTVSCLVPELAGFRNMTVITNGLHCAMALSQQEDIRIFTPGGQLVGRTNSLLGSDTMESIQKFNADIAFLSCSGLSLQSGVTEPNVEQARLKRAMLEQAQTRILLCDSSKLDKIYLSKTCDLAFLDYIISDSAPTQQWEAVLAQAGCEWISP
jgi:DeoR/GlpR family transcriptional regulator of sugar metabolism